MTPAVPKDCADHDPVYREWIRSHPCCISDMPAECAHVRVRLHGDLGNCVPLAPHLHREIHRHGIKSFARKYGIDLAQVAAAYGEAYTQRKT